MSNLAPDTTTQSPKAPARHDARNRHRVTRYGKLRLATLDQLDGRSAAYKAARQQLQALINELGNPSTLKQALAQRAVMTGAMAADFEHRYLEGEKIEFLSYLATTNTFRGICRELGLDSRIKDVETLDDYLSKKNIENGNGNGHIEPEANDDMAADGDGHEQTDYLAGNSEEASK